MGEPEWARDSRFDTALGRWDHRRELDQHLGLWTSTRDNQEVMHLLQEHGVPAGAVNTAQDLVADPHLNERSYFDVFDNPNAPRVGSRVFAGRPFRIPGIPVSMRLVSALGQHNMHALREIAGLSDEEIDRLLEQGVVSTLPK